MLLLPATGHSSQIFGPYDNSGTRECGTRTGCISPHWVITPWPLLCWTHSMCPIPSGRWNPKSYRKAAGVKHGQVTWHGQRHTSSLGCSNSSDRTVPGRNAWRSDRPQVRFSRVRRPRERPRLFWRDNFGCLNAGQARGFQQGQGRLNNDACWAYFICVDPIEAPPGGRSAGPGNKQEAPR